MDSFMDFLDGVFTVLGAMLRWIWRRPTLVQIRDLVTGPLYRVWRLMSILLAISLVAVALLVFFFYWMNVWFFHSPQFFSILGIILAVHTGLTLLFLSPLAWFISVPFAVRKVRGMRTLVQDTLDEVFHTWTRILRAITVFMVAELVFFMFHNIIPVWRNLTVLPLMVSAVMVIILLWRQTTVLERRHEEARKKIFPILNSVMISVVALCILSIVMKDGFDAVLTVLDSTSGKMGQPLYLPLAFLVVIGTALLSARSIFDSDKTQKWEIPVISGIITYVGYIVLNWIAYQWNINQYWAFQLGGILLWTGLVGVALFFKEGTGRWKRAWIGMGVLWNIVIPVSMLLFGHSQAGRAYDSKLANVSTAVASPIPGVGNGMNRQVLVNGTAVQLPDSLAVQSLYKVCPKCLTKYRGAKARRDQICDKGHETPVALIWYSDLPDSSRKKLEAGKGREKDVPRISFRVAGPDSNRPDVSSAKSLEDL